MDVASTVRVTIGRESFEARLQRDLAPLSCARLEALMPHEGQLVHARWSGESCWSPLSHAWPAGLELPPENATAYPLPGQVLLYAGDLSEPELLIAYGQVRFASKAGALAGNPVMAIGDRLDCLADLGRQVLWSGVVGLRIERIGAGSNTEHGYERDIPGNQQEAR